MKNIWKILYLTVSIFLSFYQPVYANNKVIVAEDTKTVYYILMDNYKKIKKEDFEFFLLTTNKEYNLEYRFRIKTQYKDNKCFVVEVDNNFKEKQDKCYMILTIHKDSVIDKCYKLLAIEKEKENEEDNL